MTPARGLWALLALAAAVRLWGIGFGLPALNDPDELMFELGAIHMLRTHSLDPAWFGHPATTTMYVLALANIGVFLVGRALGAFANIAAFTHAVYANPALIILPGRVIMAGFGVLCVALTDRLGTRLVDRRTGLAAAALLAVDPVHVLWSQVIRSDVVASAFLLLTLLAALDIRHTGRGTWRAALWCALAIASKWPFALGGAAVVVAIVQRRQPRLLAEFAIGVPLWLVAIAPYLLIDLHTVLANLHGEAQVSHLGATGGTPLENAWWYANGPLRAGLGIPGLILAAIGGWRLWRLPEARAILFPVAALFFALFCMQHLVWERWALPLLPLLSIAAGAALPRQWGLVAAACLPLLVDIHANAAARSHDTRQQASAWALAHVRPGSTVMVEHFAFDLLPQPWNFVFPAGDAGCVDARRLLSGQVSYAAIDADRGGRSNIDYGTMAPARRPDCRFDLAIVTQYDRYAAERTRFPEQYAAYADLLRQGRTVALFRPDKPLVGGPVTRVVVMKR